LIIVGGSFTFSREEGDPMEVSALYDWEARPAAVVTFPDTPDALEAFMFSGAAWERVLPGEVMDSGSVIPATLFAEMFPDAAANISKISDQRGERKTASR
jgi:hypothetical protein